MVIGEGIKMRNHKVLFFLLILFSLSFSMAKAKEAPAKEEVKLTVEIQKSAYVGEAVAYEVKLLSTTPHITNVRVRKKIHFPAGLEVIEGAVNNRRPEIIKEKGKQYYCWTIIRNFVIPEKSGNYTIPASQFIAFIPYEKVVYHDFWGYSRVTDYEEIDLEGKSISFKVSDLPSAKEKENLSECTGDFKIEGWFPPGRIFAGKEAYAVFSISGFGSLENLKIPNLSKLFGKGCRLKNIERDDEMMQREGRLFSKIVLTCLFVPEEEDFEIDPLCLTFFNSETKKYYETCSEPLKGNGNSSGEKAKNHNKDAIAI